MQPPATIKRLALAGILTGLLVLAGCKQSTPAGGPAAAKPAPEVGVVTMRTEPVTLTMELSGRISAQMVAEVRPQVGGIIQKRLFTEGSEVKAGEALYQIDPATFQAALASAKAALSKAEANGYSLRLRSDRYKQLVAINAVSRQEYDDAVAALKQAEADIEAGKAAVETAPASKRPTAADHQRLGHFILLCVRTTIHVKRWYLLNQILRDPQAERPAKREALDRMVALAQAESRNAREAIPLVEADSRLGWEPSMEYMTDRDHLEWKIRQVNQVVTEAIPAYRKTLEERA